MNKFSWSKALGYGFIIWGIMAVCLWILGSISSLGPLWAHGIVAAIGAISSFLFARNAKAEDGTHAISYGVIWAAVVFILDFAIVQWFDAHIFSTWQYWIAPAVVLLAPWIETEAHQVLVENPQT